VKRFRAVRDIDGTYAREGSTTDANEIVQLLLYVAIIHITIYSEITTYIDIISDRDRTCHVQLFGRGRVTRRTDCDVPSRVYG
jgi:hypothetical protein